MKINFTHTPKNLPTVPEMKIGTVFRDPEEPNRLFMRTNIEASQSGAVVELGTGLVRSAIGWNRVRIEVCEAEVNASPI